MAEEQLKKNFGRHKDFLFFLRLPNNSKNGDLPSSKKKLKTR